VGTDARAHADTDTRGQQYATTLYLQSVDGCFNSRFCASVDRVVSVLTDGGSKTMRIDDYFQKFTDVLVCAVRNPLVVLVFPLMLAVAKAINNEIESAMVKHRIRLAQRNQANYHGTWTPEDQRTKAYIRKRYRGVRNHANHIGADVPDLYKP
jgi:hypothetical protein